MKCTNKVDLGQSGTMQCGSYWGLSKVKCESCKNKRAALVDLLERHEQSRAKISSQCDTLISKKLVEDMIKELE